MAVDTELFDYFLKSNQGQELTKQRESELLVKRQESVSAIAQIKAEQQKEITKLNSNANEALKKVEKARESLEKAEQAFNEAQRVKRSKASQYDLQTGNHERYLRESADPMISAFILELRDLADSLMNNPFTVSKRPGKRNPFTMKRDDELFSNIEDVKATLAGIREAIGKTESLKLMAVDNLEEELEAIRGNIPGIKMATTGV